MVCSQRHNNHKWYYKFMSPWDITFYDILLCFNIDQQAKSDSSFIISRRALAQEGDYKLQNVCDYVGGSVRACVTQFSPKLLHTGFFVN